MKKTNFNFIFVLMSLLMFSVTSAFSANHDWFGNNLSFWLKTDNLKLTDNTRLKAWNSWDRGWTGDVGPIYRKDGLNFHPRLHFSGETLINNRQFDGTAMIFYSVQKVENGKRTLLSWEQHPSPINPDVLYPVTFYRGAGYNNKNIGVSGSNANLDGYWNDTISSFKVTDNYKLTVYSDSNFGGASGEYRTGVFDLRDRGTFSVELSYTFNKNATSLESLNDKISSYKIEKINPSPIYSNKSYSVPSGLNSAQIRNISPQQYNSKISITGDVYEILAFKDEGENHVKSYLNIKYGLTQTDEYLLSSGSVYGVDATFNNNIFALARDDKHDLHQKVSRSNNLERLVMATSPDFSSLNSNANRTALVEGQTVFIADNGKKDLEQIWRIKNGDYPSVIYLQIGSMSGSLEMSSTQVFTKDEQDRDMRSPKEGTDYIKLTLKENSEHYFRFKPTNLTINVKLPTDDLGKNFFGISKVNIPDLTVQKKHTNIYSKTVKVSGGLSLPNTLSYRSKANPMVRYAVTEINASGDIDLNETFCIADSCDKLNITLTGDANITYVWDAQHQLTIGTNHISKKAVFKLRINNKYIAPVTKKSVWIKQGDKVELLALVDVFKGSVLQGLTFTDEKGTPLDQTLRKEDINGTAHYICDFTNSMQSYNRGKINWEYGRKVYEFETVIGEAFSLNRATVYNGDTNDSTKLQEQVGDHLLAGLSTTASHKPSSFIPDASRVPVGTHALNAMIYSTHKNADVNNSLARNIFKGNIYFTRPGRYRLEWLLDTKKFPADLNGIQKLVVEVNVKWPEKSDFYHIAETPAVALDSVKDDRWFFKEIRLSQRFNEGNMTDQDLTKIDLVKNENKSFNFPLWGKTKKKDIYRSVLYFTKSDLNTLPTGDANAEEVVIKTVESRHWSNTDGRYSFSEENATIAQEITSTEHNLSVGHTGHVMQVDALKNARYNPKTYTPSNNSGQIFAVNQETHATKTSKDGKDDLVVAWYQYFTEGELKWPYKTIRYSPQWPTDTDRIVIASQLGSDGLRDTNVSNRQLKFDSIRYTNLRLYNQPNKNKKGYNPNEEHALIAPSYFYVGAVPVVNAAFALRNDLNKDNNSEDNYTSKPYVLVDYKDQQTGKYAMNIYAIEAKDKLTKDRYAKKALPYIFDYPINAGDRVTAPYPLNTVIGASSIAEIHAENTPEVKAYWEDKDTNGWAIAGEASFKSKFWYPMLDSFWHPHAKTGDVVPFTGNSKDEALKSDSKYNSPYFISKGKGYQNFKNEFEVTYHTHWKDDDIAEIRMGETVTFAGGEEKKDNPSVKGLPSVVAWASAELLYDGMNKESNVTKWEQPQGYSARLQPVVREIKIDFTDFPPKMNPATKLTTNKAGKWFFEELDAGLKQRVYYDQSAGKLVLRGILNGRFVGDRKLTKSPGGYNYILQPNVLTIANLNTLKNLTNIDDHLKDAFYRLFALSINPTLTKVALKKITSKNDVVTLSNDYQVGMSRFLRDKFNHLLVVSNTKDNDILKQELKDGLPNSSLPKGLNVKDLELKDKEDLPNGRALAVKTLAALQKGGKLVRIKKGKGYVPASQLGSGLGIFSNANLVKKGSDFNSSYIVIAENNDPTIKGVPVALHILKVNNRPYRGQIKTVFSDNVFDEKITLRHTGDFGGNVKDLIFQWMYRETDGKERPPYLYPDPSCSQSISLDKNSTLAPGWNPFISAKALPTYIEGQGGYELVFGKSAGKDVLVDNSFYVRYRHKDDNTSWSGWAGSGGNNPCSKPTAVYKSQLVEGWVKRVTDNVNVFDARIRNFSTNYAPATYVSMLEQIGQPYVGNVALNGEKDVIENVGLVALYATVLDRARDLSIDAIPSTSTPGVGQALQNAASRISQFYTLLGNEAYTDGLDPTVGYKVRGGNHGNLAPTIFTFQNQVKTLAEEELVLLRGRAGSLPGDTGAAPVHNRFLWNFTNNHGEAAYALSYDIKDKNSDGFIDFKDAKIMYPQGHGDAWGHYMTALKTYYDLLTHPTFNWVTRSEMYQIDGITLDVDYLDERKFAEAAGHKAKVGLETLALTYREYYEKAPEEQWKGYKDTKKYRAWGVDGWAKRSHIGAYYDWVTANAIIPAFDNNHTGIQKIDRTTVTELEEIAVNGNAILTQLAQMGAGQNPLGLLPDTVPFDIDPSSEKSQFEQVYARAEEALKTAKGVEDVLRNSQNMFNNASGLDHSLRQVADSQQEFSEQVKDQDRNYRTRLIDVFGSPYDGTIGAGKVYPEGYVGPDVNFYQYMDVAELNEKTLPSQSLVSYLVQHVDDVNEDVHKTLNKIHKEDNLGKRNISEIEAQKYYPLGLPVGYNTSLTTVPTVQTANYPLNEHRYALQAPVFWGTRKVSGTIQIALTEMLKADLDMRLAEKDYTGLSGSLQRIEEQMQTRLELASEELKIQDNESSDITTYAAITKILSEGASMAKLGYEAIDEITKNIQEAFPKVVGMADDVTSVERSLVSDASSPASKLLKKLEARLNLSIEFTEYEHDLADSDRSRMQVKADKVADMKELLLDIDLVLDDEPAFRMKLFKARENVRQTVQKYRKILGKGLGLVAEREAFNKKVAAKIEGMRYEDLAFRLNKTEAAEKYRVAFDTAAKYVYLAAKAYDYETNLSPTDVASSQHILRDIVNTRTLGGIKVDATGVEFIVGQGGLADIMARLKANFSVLKTQMGMNNPQLAEETFSLRNELFRVSDEHNISWEHNLSHYYEDNIWDVVACKTQMRPFSLESNGSQPGLVIPFSTEITSGKNLFGFPLTPNEYHAYDASQYATKIRSVRIRFEGYENLGLKETARAYLVPIGQDIMYVPGSNGLQIRKWNIKDQKMPVPLPFSMSDINESARLPLASLSGAEGQVRKHSAMRVSHGGVLVDASKQNKDSRLFGRSIWNTKWLLVIPGESLFNSAEEGIQRLMYGREVSDKKFLDSLKRKPVKSKYRDGHGISDIKLIFETYSYSGN